MTKPNIDEASIIAIGMALGIASTRDAGADILATFRHELDRRGFMIVAKDFGKEGLQPDFFYDPQNWETTYNDQQHVIDELREGGELEVGTVAEIGRLLRLPPIYVTVIPVDDGGSEIDEFATRAEAKTLAKSILEPQDDGS